MYPVSAQAYDRTTTTFSTDGRLFQVEYAKEAVKRGASAVSMVCADGVVFASYKYVSSPLIVSKSVEKIFVIDKHIAATTSGLVADARRLVDLARQESQRHTMLYDEPAGVSYLAKKIADTTQLYTQYGGVRPFGATILLGGYEDGEARLFEIEPSGAITEYTAAAIGMHKQELESVFEKEYNEKITYDQGISLALKALKKVIEKEDKKIKPDNFDVYIIPFKTKEGSLLSVEEIRKHYNKS